MDPRQIRALHDAMLKAFDANSLTQMLRLRLGRDLDAEVAKNDFTTVVFDLITKAERQGWLDDLVRAAREANPKSPALKEYVATCGDDDAKSDEQPAQAFQGAASDQIDDRASSSNPAVMPHFDRPVFFSLLGFLLLFIGLAIWQLPRVTRFDSGLLTFVVVITASSMASLLMFGLLRSSGIVRGNQWGFYVELGGAAAFFVVLVAGGLYYENWQRRGPFVFSIYLVSAEDQQSIVRGEGTITLRTNPPRPPAEFRNGIAEFRELPISATDQEVDYSVEIKGYELVPNAPKKLTLEPGGKVDLLIRTKKEAVLAPPKWQLEFIEESGGENAVRALVKWPLIITEWEAVALSCDDCRRVLVQTKVREAVGNSGPIRAHTVQLRVTNENYKLAGSLWLLTPSSNGGVAWQRLGSSPLDTFWKMAVPETVPNAFLVIVGKVKSNNREFPKDYSTIVALETIQ